MILKVKDVQFLSKIQKTNGFQEAFRKMFFPAKMFGILSTVKIFCLFLFYDTEDYINNIKIK